MRYYARLNPAKMDDAFLNREEVLRLSDVGAQLGFGVSVLNERGLLRDPNRLDAERPMPLLTWPLLDLLESLDLSGHRLLELGCGNSTLWFQERFKEVRSFETNPDWLHLVKSKVAANVELSLIDLPALEAAELTYRGEEVVLVDFAGRRTRFLRHFLSKLGAQRPLAIVLDNSDWYRNGAAELAQHGYQELPLHGFKSGQSYLSCTSLFLEKGRALAATKTPFHRPAFSRTVESAWDQP